MDRNVDPDADLLTDDVALRKESVDRNIKRMPLTRFFRVALRKESVDRNVFLTLTVRNVPMSLSARRAWIEISPRCGWLEVIYCRSPQGERG